MKILVFSDTHGRIDKVLEIYNSHEGIDLIVHLGDYYADAKKLEIELGRSILSIKGNMDGAFSMDEYKILETSYGKILLTHGHMEKVKLGLMNLLYKTEALDCKAVFFGHTHIPMNEELAGMRILNPGSLSLPANGKTGSYAIVNVTDKDMNATVVYL